MNSELEQRLRKIITDVCAHFSDYDELALNRLIVEEICNGDDEDLKCYFINLVAAELPKN